MADKLKNVQRNIVFGFINKIVTLFFPFAVRSIIISKLGMDYVGLNSLFSSILQVLSLAELGFGSAIVFSMYKPIAYHDKSKIGALLNLYRNTYRVIGLVILVIGVMVIPFLKSLISGGYPSDVNITILYLIYLLNTVSSYFLFAYKQSLLLANQRVDIDTNIVTIANIIMYILQIVCLLLTSNYYLYIIWLPISTIFINIIRNKIVMKMFPDVTCVGSVTLEEKRDIFKRVFGLMLTRICQVCRNSFDSIIISAFLGLEVLGKYQNYYYIMGTIVGFLGIVTSSIVASIGNDVVTKNNHDNYNRCKIFMSGYNFLASWCTVCLLCLYQPFMNLWVSKKNMLPFELVVFMCMYFYCLKMGDVVAVYKEATGIFWEDRLRPVVESIANLVLNVLLVKWLGVEGVVLSTVISITLINIPWSTHILFKVYFKQSEANYLLKMIVNTIKLVVVCVATIIILQLFNLGNDIMSFIVMVVLCSMIPIPLLFMLNYKDNDFKSFLNIVKNIFNRI